MERHEDEEDSEVDPSDVIGNHRPPDDDKGGDNIRETNHYSLN